MKSKAQITISRNSANEVNISIVDVLSRTEFVDIKMSPHDFAMAITGLSYIDVDMETRGLSNVGKVKQIESRKAICPLKTYDRTDLENWLRDNKQEAGWSVDPYLGSQHSVKYLPDGTRELFYRVYRFVEAD